MKVTTRYLFVSAMSLSAAAFTLPKAARAELPERKSPLADAPAVRHRAELRQFRFEIGPGVTTTVGQDFYHAVMVGGKASFFLSDWLAIGGFFGHNVTPGLKTSFHERVDGVLPEKSNDRTPTRTEAYNGMNKIGQAMAVQAELIPFSGKYSLFGKIFANYDLYAFGGPGFINFKGNRPACPDNMPGNSCPVTGMKVGANFGIGFRTFINDYFSLNIEFRDVLLKNNPSGRDETGDKIANAEDLSLDSNYMVGFNLTFLLPPTARVSD
jgi:outer membrane beta-barrel protein